MPLDELKWIEEECRIEIGYNKGWLDEWRSGGGGGGVESRVRWLGGGMLRVGGAGWGGGGEGWGCEVYNMTENCITRDVTRVSVCNQNALQIRLVACFVFREPEEQVNWIFYNILKYKYLTFSSTNTTFSGILKYKYGFTKCANCNG